MFRYRHFIHKWYADEKTSLKEERYKWVSKEWSNYVIWLKV